MKIFNKHAINKHINFYNYISADSVTRNFSCTDVNNNLQLKTADRATRQGPKPLERDLS